jgi:hypothetical protein
MNMVRGIPAGQLKVAVGQAFVNVQVVAVGVQYS